VLLRHITSDLWTILAVCTNEGRCDVLEFAEQLEQDQPAENARLMRAFARMSTCGPPHNVHRSRALAHDIFEIKTTGGVRVLYFYDEGRTIVCSAAMRKPKQRSLEIAVERAARCRWRYLNDKRRGALRILELP